MIFKFTERSSSWCCSTRNVDIGVAERDCSLDEVKRREGVEQAGTKMEELLVETFLHVPGC